jgi:hypothetical protein
VAAGHDVSDVFVFDGTEHFDSVLEDVCLDHLFEVDRFRTRAGNNEACVWLLFEDARDGSCEEIGAFVVEEAGNDDDDDRVSRSETFGDGFAAESWVLRGGRVVPWTEILCHHSVRDD